MPDVFISYSRRNLDFVQQLVGALKKSGKDPWFDQLKEPLTGIAAGAPWWQQIQDGIESVDNFLFVISPDSISSPYCHAEINYAREHGKRLVPLLYCGWIGESETRTALDAAIEAIPDDEAIPDSVTSSILNLKKLVRQNWLAISEIQYVTFASSIPFEQSLEQLIQALDLDLAWVKMHSQLVQAAKLWESNNFHEDYLWGAVRLKPVHEMIARRKPELEPLVQEFIRPEQERLYRLLQNHRTTHQERLKIGERLAIIGDTRKGVGVKRVILNRRTFAIPEIDWCPVEVTAAKQSSQWPTIEVVDRRLEIRPFSIARYLITHQQFETFMDDPEGFTSGHWWQGMPEKYQRQEVQSARNQFDNAPRDTVTWYQAVAFCRWLDDRYTLLELKPDSKLQIRLPTEWEWQWVAQNGQEGREYPWGKWDDQPRANTLGVGINDRSIAVGMYPDGAAACGALDFAGNLWQWCLNNRGYGLAVNLYDDHYKALRGGSFNASPSNASSSDRFHFSILDLNLKKFSFGFRVALAFPIQGI